jgi:phage virion morphogenesis protein
MTDEIRGMSRLVRRLEQLALDTRRVEAPLKAAGQVAVHSIEQNFKAQGRPQKWTPLQPRTLARRRKGRGKGGARILIDTARLKNSINAKLVEGPGVAVGTNVIYARRHHYGYPGGKGRGRSKTPARPFMLLQPEDIDSIDRIFVRHIAKR